MGKGTENRQNVSSMLLKSDGQFNFPWRCWEGKQLDTRIDGAWFSVSPSATKEKGSLSSVQGERVVRPLKLLRDAGEMFK